MTSHTGFDVDPTAVQYMHDYVAAFCALSGKRASKTYAAITLVAEDYLVAWERKHGFTIPADLRYYLAHCSDTPLLGNLSYSSAFQKVLKLNPLRYSSFDSAAGPDAKVFDSPASMWAAYGLTADEVTMVRQRIKRWQSTFQQPLFGQEPGKCALPEAGFSKESLHVKFTDSVAWMPRENVYLVLDCHQNTSQVYAVPSFVELLRWCGDSEGWFSKRHHPGPLSVVWEKYSFFSRVAFRGIRSIVAVEGALMDAVLANDVERVTALEVPEGHSSSWLYSHGLLLIPRKATEGLPGVPPTVHFLTPLDAAVVFYPASESIMQCLIDKWDLEFTDNSLRCAFAASNPAALEYVALSGRTRRPHASAAATARACEAPAHYAGACCLRAELLVSRLGSVRRHDYQAPQQSI